MPDTLSNLVTRVRHAPNLRCRDEGDGKYLIYCSDTDEMHIIGDLEKAIFDLCADASLDDILNEASQLIEDRSRVDITDPEHTIISLLKAFHDRKILIFPDA